MRGNLGYEINAVYDVFQPDFIIIAPAHPEKGRTVKEGIHYLNGIELHETEVASDPKTPVRDPFIKRLVQDQSGREVGHLTHRELNEGNESVLQRLASFKQQKKLYVTVDSTSKEDLEKVIQIIMTSEYSVIWCGSAGLINYLPRYFGLIADKQEVEITRNKNPVLFVVGSVSKVGRNQLNYLLFNSEVVGVEIDSIKVVTDEQSKELELKRKAQKTKSFIKKGKNVVLFSSLNLTETLKIGEIRGISPIDISDLISNALGEIAVNVIEELKVCNLFLTGGDTAQQVFSRLHVKEYELIGELEAGIPIGRLASDKQIIAITKAGNFGTKSVMVKALHKLRGEL